MKSNKQTKHTRDEEIDTERLSANQRGSQEAEAQSLFEG